MQSRIRHMIRSCFVGFLALGMASPTKADGPADNLPDQVRPIPPQGIELTEATTQVLLLRCRAIRTQWDSLIKERTNKAPQDSTDTPSLENFASEILVFPRAVELAIEFGQFYKPNEPESASALLDEAARRIEVVRNGGRWQDVVGLTDSNGQRLIIGGYRSRLDDSIQPYSLVIPAGYHAGNLRPRRLDIWFHGRGETLSEVAFLSKQRVNAGQFTPVDTFVLHPYGRYSNAFKFAGEIDVLEALAHVQQRLPVDSNRISVRGFSMGGAACWQFATHYADRWFAANPGAGFSETPEFLASFQNEQVRQSAPPYQQLLWQLYDCPPWAINLMQCPTVAYSGEIDRQKQAADVMAKVLATHGIDLVHIIGPQTGHKIHPDSKKEIETRLNALASVASPLMPRTIHFATVTLRYHRMHWVDVRGLERHWVPAQVQATADGSTIRLSTNNVTRLHLNFPPGQWTGPASGHITVQIDGAILEGPLVASDRSWQCKLIARDGQWKLDSNQDEAIRKSPGRQGPIDDAFMERFLFVLPSGRSTDPAIQRWVDSESLHAMMQWRKHFRGDIRHIMDHELSDDDIAQSNLILFGDPQSNEAIGRIVNQLPIVWNDAQIKIGSAKASRSGHVPILIYPNPMNQDRYIVINSGFTFREYDYLNNARQTPKLPDWALVDIRDGATTRDPGKVVAAGFFDERWQPQ